VYSAQDIANSVVYHLRTHCTVTMGCQGSKTAKASKPAQQQALSRTLLQQPIAQLLKPHAAQSDNVVDARGPCKLMLSYTAGRLNLTCQDRSRQQLADSTVAKVDDVAAGSPEKKVLEHSTEVDEHADASQMPLTQAPSNTEADAQETGSPSAATTSWAVEEQLRTSFYQGSFGNCSEDELAHEAELANVACGSRPASHDWRSGCLHYCCATETQNEIMV
jgi:hypothetical protein